MTSGGRSGAGTVDFAYYPFALLCLGGLVVCATFNATWPALALCCLGVLTLAAADFRGLLLLAYPAYALLGALFSVVLIENGAFVTEQGRIGTNVGASSLLAIYALGFLTVAHFGLSVSLGRRRDDAQAPPTARRLRGVIVAACIGIGLFYAALFASYGLGTSYPSRFDWIATFPSIVKRLHDLVAGFVIPPTFALAGVYGRLHGRDWALWALALPALALFGTGEKFSAFVSAILMAVAGAGIGAYLDGRPMRLRASTLRRAVLVVIALSVMLVVGYRRFGDVDVVEVITQRIVLQGHVWFGIMNLFRGTPEVPLAPLIRVNSLDTPSGLDYLSYLVADPAYVHARLMHGINFTMGGPPSVLAYAGSASGAVLYSLLGFLYVLAALWVLAAVRRDSALMAAAAFAVFALVGAATQMGRWDSFRSTLALACYALLALGAVHAALDRPKVRRREPAELAELRRLRATTVDRSA